MLTGIAPTTSSASSTSSATASTNSMDAQQDRFLKLLVAQLNNQDPMNPVDNAQMTSQMAQINTVTGIQQVNETLKSMAAQFTALLILLVRFRRPCFAVNRSDRHSTRQVLAKHP